MSESRLEKRGSPKGLLRLLVRLPVWLYRIGLGFVLGKRFLMIEHTGRKSGLTRRTVVEVVADHPDAVFVVAAWGRKAQWFQNVLANPEVRITIGRHKFDSVARVLEAGPAEDILAEYAEAHPGAFANLAKVVLTDPGEPEDNLPAMAAAIPVVELPRPRA